MYDVRVCFAIVMPPFFKFVLLIYVQKKNICEFLQHMNLLSFHTYVLNLPEKSRF